MSHKRINFFSSFQKKINYILRHTSYQHKHTILVSRKKKAKILGGAAKKQQYNQPFLQYKVKVKLWWWFRWCMYSNQVWSSVRVYITRGKMCKHCQLWILKIWFIATTECKTKPCMLYFKVWVTCGNY